MYVPTVSESRMKHWGKFKFNDLDVGSKIKRPYHHLSYSSVTVGDIGAGRQARGVIPHSKPKYALNGPYPNGFIYAPTLSIADTNTTSFDLHELWVGCLNVNNTKNGYNAIQCEIYLQCTTPADMDGNEGPVFALYTPSSGTGAAVMKMLPGFTYRTSAYFKITGSTAGAGSTIFVTDSYNYTIQQVEVFTNLPEGYSPPWPLSRHAERKLKAFALLGLLQAWIDILIFRLLRRCVEFLDSLMGNIMFAVLAHPSLKSFDKFFVERLAVWFQQLWWIRRENDERTNFRSACLGY